MKPTDLTTLTAHEVAARVRQKKVPAVEVTRAALERIERVNGTLKAFITVTAGQALREAAQVDKDVRSGKDKPLAGVPLAVKDLYETKGVRTTAGSRTSTRTTATASTSATMATLGGEERPLVRVYLDPLLPFNLTGQPALSIPCGFIKNGLPLGLPLVGRPFEEALLLRVAHAYETQTEWHKRQP